jgi:hypothetical protein
MKSRQAITAVVVTGVCLWAGVSGPLHAAAAATYYFHGGAADDAQRAAGTPTATFDGTAPTGATPSTQTSTPRLLAANPCGDMKDAYWVGPFTGSISGHVHIDWWWQTSNAEAIAIGTQQDITVCGDGTQIGSLKGAPVAIGPTPTESTVDVPVSGTVTSSLVIEAVPTFTDTGEQNTVLYNSTAEPSFFSIATGPPPTPSPTAIPTATPPPSGMTGPQVFHNYQAPYPYPHEPPPPTVVALLFGEPSIGVDWATNNTMYQGDLNTWQVNFDYSVKPPVATWNDRGHQTTSESSLDARLITDHAGNPTDRTFVEQLHLPTSVQAYTDTDGGTAAPPANSGDWVATTSGLNGGVDHESIGAGRYSTTATPPSGAGTLYPHAVYYCAQNTVNAAFCTRSDTGGATYGTPVQAFSSTQCTTLHGKPRVGPDGVVYLPDKDCSGAGGANAAKGVVISKDNGANWSLANIPNTSTDGNQPDSDVAVGGSTGMGTVYYTYRDGDHHGKVVVSNDDGSTWSTPIDLGSFFGIQNIQFPEVIAGDQNRAAVSFIGTSVASRGTGGQGDAGDDISDNFADLNGAPAIWYLYTAFTYDGGKTWQVVNDTPNDPVQRGGVCMSGTGCTGSDRNMLDFNDMTIDKKGRVQVAYTDGCSGPCEANSAAAACSVGNQNCMGTFSSIYSMVDQVCGMGLFKAFDPGFFNNPTCPTAPPPANTPETPLVAGVAGIGLATVGIAFLFRRRRGKYEEDF